MDEQQADAEEMEENSQSAGISSVVFHLVQSLGTVLHIIRPRRGGTIATTKDNCCCVSRDKFKYCFCAIH